MQLLTRLIAYFYCFPVLAVSLFAQESAVSLKDQGTYYELILDYTTGVTHFEMGKQIAQKLLVIFPNLEELTDKSLAERIVNQSYDLGITANQSYEVSLGRMNDIKPQVQQEYLDEMEGIYSVLSSSNNNVFNDGLISLDEIYMTFLSSDIFERNLCSSISVFGSRSATGSSITARLNDGSGNPDKWGAMTQSVITIKNTNHSICMIGGLSIGAATAFNDEGIFAALHSSTVDMEYSSKNKRSYLMDVRYALENFSSSDDIAAFFTTNSKNYVRNNLIQLTDKNSTRILENNFSGAGENIRCTLRCDTSTLNPGITWGFPNAIATANAFLLAGNNDNHTNTLSCTARWNTFKNQLQLCGDKVDWEELKLIASYDNGDGPGLQETGDIYNIGTKQIVLFQPDNFRLEIAFKPRTDNLADDPVFEEIPVYIGNNPNAVDEKEDVTADYNLKQNYPNPFNPVTNFEFRISDFPGGGTSGFVSLKVFDVLGNEVAILINEEIIPGEYKIEFDATKYNLSSGIYFYRLRTGKFTDTKKLVLTK